LLSLQPAIDYIGFREHNPLNRPSFSIFDIPIDFIAPDERALLAEEMLVDAIKSSEEHERLPATARLHRAGVLYLLVERLSRIELSHMP
jgi:hypothetical protein